MDQSMYKPRVDSHVHSCYSYDALDFDRPGALAESAVKAGLDVLTISDHCDMRASWKGYKSFFPVAEERYAEIQAEKARFADSLQILCGLELGDVSNQPELARQHLGQYAYDFVLGAVHHPRDDRWVDIKTCEPETLLALYFDELDALLDFGDFDCLAHLDYPARIWNVPNRTFLPFRERIDAILRRTAEKGLALEVNSSGLFDARMGRIGPEQWVLEHFRAYGGKYITLGSDSHHAAHVGRGLAEALSLIRAAGFDSVTYYEKRKPIQMPIG